NGNGAGTAPDRIHTQHDSIGVDSSLPPDGIFEKLYIDPNFLRRNSMTTGVNMGLLAISPPKPSPLFVPGADNMKIIMQGEDTVYNHYRVGIRTRGSGSLYFDTVMTFYSDSFIINNLQGGKRYFFSVMNVKNTVESIFTDEQSQIIANTSERGSVEKDIELMQNYPNPNNNKEMMISILVKNQVLYRNAEIVIKDSIGRDIKKIPVELKAGKNDIIFNPLKNMKGIYTYSLKVGEKIVQTRKMVIL
ncbi:MAG: hypothetical protein PHD97_01745, partial [Bacteroidales bacterium]|nr:hypothetical protein [Bacteroidales bacterium]